MSNSEIGSLAVLAALLAVAVYTDLKARRIPNSLILVGIALGFLFQALAFEGDGLFARWWGSIGVVSAGLGMLTGLTLLIPMYALRTLGAGDVKLVAMLGVWFGPRPTLGLIVFTLLAGGVLALLAATYSRTLGKTLVNVREMGAEMVERTLSRSVGSMDLAGKTHGRLPYAVAIAVGTVAEVCLMKGWLRF